MQLDQLAKFDVRCIKFTRILLGTRRSGKSQGYGPDLCWPFSCYLGSSVGHRRVSGESVREPY